MNCSFCNFLTDILIEYRGNQLCELCYATVNESFLKMGDNSRTDGWSMLAVISLQNNLIMAMIKEKDRQRFHQED